MSFLDKEDKWFLDSLKEHLVIAEEDREIMEYALYDVYSHRLNRDLEYYSEVPVMLRYCHISVLDDLREMEREYLEKEEYEKCAIILKVRDKLIKEFSIKVKPKPLCEV